jgi:hypothetical protein
MGRAYVGLLADRNLVLVQLQSLAASDDPVIRDQMRTAASASSSSSSARRAPARTRSARFFAQGMLLNVLAAMGAEEVEAHWAQVLLGPPKDECC